MDEISFRQIVITSPFWFERQSSNARMAIIHQWHQLEQSHCIDNFRLAAGMIQEGFREGWFFADSDAYKWLEAASNVFTFWPASQLKKLMDDFIAVLGRAQGKDGYLFTFNQIHFPGEAHWQNPLIEHELYCHGHLIEAGIAHFLATGDGTALEIACRAADLLVMEFLLTGSKKTSGHEEIEIALIRLYQLTAQRKYLELAGQFLENRGKLQPFALWLLSQYARVNRRDQVVRRSRQQYVKDHPGREGFQLPSDNYAKSPWMIKIRWMLNTLTGKFFQMHAPIRRQIVPVGHSVRFAYLETAIAKYYRQRQDATLLPALLEAWERMVVHRMFVTGGIGSLPEVEGFGRDDELDPEIAYAETCAALGCMFWNWEMTLITTDARYADLLEWQLYNAAAVGMGRNGDAYLYNNPLSTRGGISRRPWFRVPCCPSNLSRTWASLGKYIFSTQASDIWIHQYIGCQTKLETETPVGVELISGFPWEGRSRILLSPDQASEWTLWLRIPSWADQVNILVNGQRIEPLETKPKFRGDETASGYDPRKAWYLPIHRVWQQGDAIELDFPMSILPRRCSPRVRACSGKVALTRGPLVYCLESKDNPGMDIFAARLDPGTLHFEFSPSLLGGTGVITSGTEGKASLTFIPYQLWANRGDSQMTVWVKS